MELVVSVYGLTRTFPKAEVETYLELMPLLGFAPSERIVPLLELAASVSRQLIALRDSLSRRLQEDSPSYDPGTS